MNDQTLAISIVEAARRAGIGRSSIYAAIKRGDLKIKKAGRRSLVLVKDLEGFVSALPDAGQRDDA
jgi:excisionase family DNA binding protein